MAVDVTVESTQRPRWPTARPPVAPMTSRHCWDMTILTLWRCARALLLMVFDTPYDVEPDNDGVMHAPAWPFVLPDLANGDQFVDAALACNALAWWIGDVLDRAHHQRAAGGVDQNDAEVLEALEWHLLVTYKQLNRLSTLLMNGNKGKWDRDEAVWVCDEMLNRLTELCIAEWRA